MNDALLWGLCGVAIGVLGVFLCALVSAWMEAWENRRIARRFDELWGDTFWSSHSLDDPLMGPMEPVDPGPAPDPLDPVARSLALEVLKGDLVAARALADRVQELVQGD